MKKLIIIAVLTVAGITGCGKTVVHHHTTPPSYQVSPNANIPGYETTGDNNG